MEITSRTRNIKNNQQLDWYGIFSSLIKVLGYLLKVCGATEYTKWNTLETFAGSLSFQTLEIVFNLSKTTSVVGPQIYYYFGVL